MDVRNDNPFLNWSDIQVFEQATDNFVACLKNHTATPIQIHDFKMRVDSFNKQHQFKGLMRLVFEKLFPTSYNRFCHDRDFNYQKAHYILKLVNLDCNSNYIDVTDEFGYMFTRCSGIGLRNLLNISQYGVS